ncbi:MAG TPA: MFS transporter [Streptosporangiaceae bacterium]|nr:MFS transporter [Streptosporangiaceae bacterium]
MAAAGAPSPLYDVYQGAWKFSATTLTVIFAVYAIALLAAFLVLGRLSDHVGRKPVIIIALLVEVAAIACFLAADSVALLYTARILQGLATGAATGAISASLIELHPPGNTQLAPLINSSAPSMGLAVGALGSSLLVQYAPAPLRFVYWILLAMCVLGIALTLGIREPGQRRDGVLASLRPQAGIPAAARRTFITGVPCLIACWALGGFYLALAPSVAATMVQSTDAVVGGSVIFLLTSVGAASTVLFRNVSPPVAMAGGCLLLTAGVAGTVGSIAAGSVTGLFLGTAVSGIGFGLGFLGVFRVLSALAPPEGRAAMITAIYIVSYLGFSLPVIAAGFAATHVGLHTTALVYGSAVAGLALLAAIGLATSLLRPALSPPAEAVTPASPCCAPIHAGAPSQAVTRQPLQAAGTTRNQPG